MATPPKKPAAASDPALPPLSDAELDALSVITPADIASAQRAWRKDAPPAGKPLLDATDADTAS